MTESPTRVDTATESIAARPNSPALDGVAPALSDHDRALVQALWAGDEDAFESLVNQYYAAMVRLATVYVASPVVAGEMVQDTWLEVFHSLHRFKGRQSLKIWIFRILLDRAKGRGEGVGSAGSTPVSWSLVADQDESVTDLERLNQDDIWASYPTNWESVPEQVFLSDETQARIQAAIRALPVAQQQIIILRDIDGWSADEVCSVLAISQVSQLALLHRARSRVRRALEQQFHSEMRIAA
jgi:RNA polymerase sigma-70 factor (ECF subfamily)